MSKQKIRFLCILFILILSLMMVAYGAEDSEGNGGRDAYSIPSGHSNIAGSHGARLDWSWNENQHYKMCKVSGCLYVYSRGDHKLVDGVCSTCQYKDPNYKPAPEGHNGDGNHEAVGELRDWDKNGTHYKKCAVSGCNYKYDLGKCSDFSQEVLKSQTADAHDYVVECKKCGSEIDHKTSNHILIPTSNKDGLSHKLSCEVCGYIKYQNQVCSFGDFTKLDSTYHHKVCSVCGQEVTERHTYPENGPDGHICSVCKSERDGYYDSVSCLHLSFRYEDNGDGTHKAICKQCEDVNIESHEGTFVYEQNSQSNHIKITKCSKCEAKIAETKEPHKYNDKGVCQCGLVNNDHGHIYNKETKTFDDKEHWDECVICGYRNNVKEHMKDTNGLIVSNEDGHSYFCKDCGYQYPVEIHGYKNNEKKLYNDEVHWNECIFCHYKLDEKQHDYKEKPTFNGNVHIESCKECDYTFEANHLVYSIVEKKESSHILSCACGYMFPEEEHVWPQKKNGGGIEYYYNDSGHFTQCQKCWINTQPSQHVPGNRYFLGVRPNTHVQYCQYCDYTYKPEDCSFNEEGLCVCGNANHDHKWQWAFNDESHYMECSSCGYKRMVNSHEKGEVFADDSRGHRFHCTLCKYDFPIEEHSFNTNGVCDICSYTSSLPNPRYTSSGDEISYDVNIEFNGEIYEAPEGMMPPVIVNDRTLIPLRGFEELGAEIEWDDETKTASGTLNGVKVEIPIGANYILVDGEKVEIDVPAQIINDRTMMPGRSICEAWGLEVEWNDEEKIASFSNKI